MKALYLRDKYLDSYMGEKDGRPCYTGPGRAKVWINGEIFNLAWVWPHGIVFLYRHFTKWIASLGLRSRFQLLPRNCQDFISSFFRSIAGPGPRIVPSCHPGWGAVSDLGGSFAERGFKMGHRHSGTTTRAKTAPFQLSFHTLIFRCFVLIPSLCLLSASFFPLC